MIELVGAGAYASRPIGELSGGEQQRLLIAQALVRRPEILLLDEPLDSLDLSNQGAIAGLVQRISHSQGVTVLLVAHDVNPILGYLDRVVYFAGGRGLCGAPREVVSGPDPEPPLRGADRGPRSLRRPPRRRRHAGAAGPPPRPPRPCTLSSPASPGTWSATSNS